MTPYDLKDYLNTDEFAQLSKFLAEVKTANLESTRSKYPDYLVRSRVNEGSKDYEAGRDYYVDHFNIPHYDFYLSEFLLHQGTSGFLDMEVFAFQMNSFCKSIFHRKMWNDWNAGRWATDHFLNYVYDNWTKHQRNGEFTALEQQAHKVFAECNSLVDYYKQFVYNQDYTFITLDDMLELADATLASGIWFSKYGNLYEVYKDTEYSTQSIDTKILFHTGAMTKLDVLHVTSAFKTQVRPMLKTISTKFNWIPVDDPDEKFNGLWACPKFNNRVWFIPQVIVFYNP